MRNGVVCASTIKMTDNCEIYQISCNIYFNKLHNRNRAGWSRSSARWFRDSVTLSPCKKAGCTLVQALRLCTGRTAHRVCGGLALLFLDHGTRKGWGVSVTARPLFTPGKDPVPTVQEAGWAPGPVWTGAENLTPTGIRSPDRPARSQSLYRLRYPAHMFYPNWWQIIVSDG